MEVSGYETRLCVIGHGPGLFVVKYILLILLLSETAITILNDPTYIFY